MDKNVSDVWLGKKETLQDNSMQTFTVFLSGNEKEATTPSRHQNLS